MDKALSVLKDIDRKIVYLNHTMAILGWDQDTVMPPKAGEERGEQYALLSSLIHDYSTSEALKNALSELDENNLEEADAALVRYWKKELDRASRIPSSLVQAKSLATNEANAAWREGRKNNSWKTFEPALERVVDLTREEASLLSDGRDLYDTLLDLYEEGMDQKTVDMLFADLETTTHEMMDKLEGIDIDDSFLFSGYDEKALHSFCMDLTTRMGFDFNRGMVGITPHPYTTSLGMDDHRISTRYTDDGLFDPIGSIVHESGHALYEMCATANPLIRGTSLAQGCSMGLHESQSRFWENIMGRSLPFWEFQYPRLQKAVPSLKGISLESFMKAINKSKPSAIRVNADELTYNLHIILRYRLEKELVNGDLKVSDVPARWNEMSKSLIRYEVKSDREGALQDVHWSQGSIGYFPTYSIGNIYSAAFYKKMCADLGGKEKVEQMLRSGDYSQITSWQGKNIWSKGMMVSPSSLVESVTGQKVDVTPFKEYLVTKFSDLYLN